MIGIVDYGAGNLRSVKKALDFLGAESRIVAAPGEIEGIEKMILPGVGAFRAAMEKLQEKDLFRPVAEWLAADRPFLGICLGMQILFESGEESPEVPGFGIFRGAVPRFRQGRVPQIGWNRVRFSRPTLLSEGLEDGAFFYFLHGFYVVPEEASIVCGETEYGIRYPSMIRRGNIYAVQFHPEKSADNGLKLLQNWVDLS